MKGDESGVMMFVLGADPLGTRPSYDRGVKDCGVLVQAVGLGDD